MLLWPCGAFSLSASETPEGRTFAAWFRSRGGTSYEACGLEWYRYAGALVPLTLFPIFPMLAPSEERELLRRSGALALRYTPPVSSGTETAFWYVVCPRYAFDELSAKMRNQVRRGRGRCVVERLLPTTVAEEGFACFQAALARHGKSAPERETFRREILAQEGAPFEFWGVRAGGVLGAYAICVVEPPRVALSVLKIDPACFDAYPAYALLDALLEHYVAQRGMVLSNGARAVAHETQFQEFLLKFGFLRQYCALRLAYTPLLDLAVRGIYPFRRLVRGAPLARWRSLLFQEEIARSTATLLRGGNG